MSSESKLQLLLLSIGVVLVSPLYYLRDGGLFSEILFYFLLSAGTILLGVYISKNPDIALRPSYVFGTTIFLYLVTIPHGIFIDTEVYRHIWDGLIQSEGENPYAYTPFSEAWFGLRGHEVFQHLQEPRFYSASAPVEMVFHRFLAWLEPVAGLNGLIIAYKLFAILSGLGVIWLLLKLLGSEDVISSHILLFAWNPVILLMIAGQGTLDNLAVLSVLGIVYFMDHEQQEIMPMFWGISMHLTLLTWILLPWLIYRVRWSYLLIALGTWAVWWLPFFSSDALLNYFNGLISYHLYPAASATLGYLVIESFSNLYSGSEQWIYAILMIAFTAFILLRGRYFSDYNSYQVIIPSFLISMLLWVTIPNFSTGLLTICLALGILDSRLRFYIPILSVMIVPQIIALRLDEWTWIPALINSIILVSLCTYMFITQKQKDGIAANVY